MHLRYLVVATLALLLLPCIAPAQDASPSTSKTTSSSSTKKKPTAKKSASKASASKSSSKRAAGKRASVRKKSARGRSRRLSQVSVRRINRAFVASAELKPMANQLILARTPAAYNGVESWTQRHAATDAGALGYIVLGYARLQDRQYTEAIADLKKAQPRAGELADYVEFFLGEAYAGNNDSAAAIEHLRDFETRYPESLHAHEALIAYANVAINANQQADAIKALEANRTPTRADIELALARAYVKNGQELKGALLLQHLYYRMPLAPEADAAQAEIKKLPNVPGPTLSDRLGRADLLLKGRRYNDAARDYRSLLDDVSGEQRSEVLADLAVAMVKSGSTREAQTWLDQIPPNAAGEVLGQKLYNDLEIARNANDDERVNSYLAQLRERAPNSSWLQEGLFVAGNMYMLKHDYDHAIDAYREIHQRFPQGPRAAYAHWRAAWLDLRQGRNDAAQRQFREQVELYPNTTEATAAMYWEGRLLEEKGDLPAARAWYSKLSERYRNYYYAIMARDRLHNIGQQTVADDPLLARIHALPAPDDSVADITPPVDDLRMEKSKLLENAGLIDFAVKELQAVPGCGSGNWASLQVARIFTDNNQPHRALQYLKRVVPSYTAQEIGVLPTAYWRVLFPRPYWPEVQRFATENNLDPYLVASLIRQESEFNPGAVSYANAYGLMQLLPGTGKTVARSVGMKHYNTAALLSPTTNIELGTRYFREMTDKLGMIEYALAAYNAGSDRVQDWRDTGHYRDIQEFVESIPFVQTRDYVQSIVRNAAIYRRLYSGNAAATAPKAESVAEKTGANANR
jgi:soluble lytic murein transglycosylase